jgi:EAL domain-containing protein (putative c-di-GMP-specific phosphodiesterase class I)
MTAVVSGGGTPTRVLAGDVIGVETLLRWRSALPGAQLPAVVVAEAERSGAIFGLGDWVLRQACRDTVRWQGRGIAVARTSVNVSAHQITGPAFVHKVERALHETGADPTRLCLELTESSTLPDDRGTVDVLVSLKALGLQLWLDDFGSGYSSLNYLRVFPLDAVKIDPSFAHRLPHDRASRAIIASTIAMCHELGMEVIIEGVENAAELVAATELGADACQGFFLGRPQPAHDVGSAAPWRPLASTERDTTPLSSPPAAAEGTPVPGFRAPR